MDWTTASTDPVGEDFITRLEVVTAMAYRDLSRSTLTFNTTILSEANDQTLSRFEVSTITWSATKFSGKMQDDAAGRLIATMNGLIIPILYFVLFFIGFLGNAVVVYVSCCLRRRNKTAVDIYVGNLAIADIALITSLPFWAVTHLLNGVWKFKDSGCKIMSFLTHLNMYSSILFITAMAVDRYTVVVKPIQVRAKSLRSARRTLMTCILVWFISFLLSLPAAIMRKEKYLTNTSDKIVCSWDYPKNSVQVWWALHIVFRQIIGFVIPLSIICRCYCVIMAYVNGRTSFAKKGTRAEDSNADDQKAKQQKHVSRLVTVIILAFIICWLPNHTSNFYHSLVHFKALPRPLPGKPAEVVYLVHLFSTVLSFCNSVINPVIYSTNPCHRAHIKSLFFRVCRCFKNMDRSGSYGNYLSRKDDMKDSNTGRRRRETEFTKIPSDIRKSSPFTPRTEKAPVSLTTNVTGFMSPSGGLSPLLTRGDENIQASEPSVELSLQPSPHTPQILVQYGRGKLTTSSS